MSDLNRQVGENVRRLRQSAQLSQAALAEHLCKRGFSFRQPTVAKIENGSRPLRLDESHAIASTLGVKVSALVDGIFTDVALMPAALMKIDKAIGLIRETLATLGAQPGEHNPGRRNRV